MHSFFAMLIAIAVREAYPDETNVVQISNGVIAVAIMDSITRA